MPDKSKIESIIHSLDINEELKHALLNEVKKTKKQVDRLDFQLNRTKNDRDIAVNLLNFSIDDLEKKQKELAFANFQLSKQKQLLESQSQDLKISLKKLEDSYKELEQFSYIASHDLKSPLRSIAGFAQLLQKKYTGQINDEADQYIDFIIKSTIHMGNIIRDLLEYSKTGKNELPFEETNINDIIVTVIENLKSEIEDSNAIIRIGKIPTLSIYRTGLTQMFQNLISNSIKFTKSNIQPTIKISANKEGKSWKFAVTDNGIGLDEDFQKKSKENGYDLIVRNLSNSSEDTLKYVTEYQFTENGSFLAILTTGIDSSDYEAGIYIYNTANGEMKAAFYNPLGAKNMTWDKAGEQLAWIANIDTSEAGKSAQLKYHDLFYWDNKNLFSIYILP